MEESQDTIADNVSSNSSFDLLARIIKSLEDDDLEELRQVILDEKNRQEFLVIGWDLVPEICRYLTDDVKYTNLNKINICEDILLCVATHGNPKELLLAFLEQIDQFKDDVKFKALLPPLQLSLARLPAKRHHSLDITLETIYAHLHSLPKPEFHELVGDEKGLLEMEPSNVRIADVVTATLDFIDPFVEEIVVKRKNLGDTQELDSKSVYQQKQLARFLFQLLDHPLSYTEMEYREDSMSKSDVRIAVESMMVYLAKLYGDFDVMVKDIVASNCKITMSKPSEDDADAEKLWANEKTSQVAIGCFLYILHHESICIDSYPWVFNNQFRLESSLPYITALLADEHPLVTGKGILLASRLIKNLPMNRLMDTVFDMTEYTSFIRGLLQVVTYCPSKEVRQNGVQIFPSLLSKMTINGRAKFLTFVLNVASHAGVLGYTIHLLKDELSKMLSSTSRGIFPTKVSKNFFRLVFTLKDGSTTDLLDRSDKIMAALNMLRFLVIRDKPGDNKTGIWDAVGEIEKNFLAPLRTGLDMSRAHYELEAKELQEGKKGKKMALETSLEVGGQALPEMNDEQHVKMLQLALHTFDMMDSVLGRVNELIDCKGL